MVRTNKLISLVVLIFFVFSLVTFSICSCLTTKANAATGDLTLSTVYGYGAGSGVDDYFPYGEQHQLKDINICIYEVDSTNSPKYTSIKFVAGTAPDPTTVSDLNIGTNYILTASFPSFASVVVSVNNGSSIRFSGSIAFTMQSNLKIEFNLETISQETWFNGTTYI